MADTELSDQARQTMIDALRATAGRVVVYNHQDASILSTDDDDVITAVFEHIALPFD
jgi:hypothetical protein